MILLAASKVKTTGFEAGSEFAVRLKVASWIFVDEEKPATLVLTQVTSILTLPFSGVTFLTGQVQSPVVCKTGLICRFEVSTSGRSPEYGYISRTATAWMAKPEVLKDIVTGKASPTVLFAVCGLNVTVV